MARVRVEPWGDPQPRGRERGDQRAHRAAELKSVIAPVSLRSRPPRLRARHGSHVPVPVARHRVSAARLADADDRREVAGELDHRQARGRLVAGADALQVRSAPLSDQERASPAEDVRLDHRPAAPLGLDYAGAAVREEETGGRYALLPDPDPARRVADQDHDATARVAMGTYAAGSDG